ncbi:hypothetical protein ACJX0J_032507, partial [Zea mays]
MTGFAQAYILMDVYMPTILLPGAISLQQIDPTTAGASIATICFLDVQDTSVSYHLR